MPSKESRELEGDKNDYFPSEVEDLVTAINHNLQLKSRPCIAVCCSKQRRVSPYTVPVRTLCRRNSGDKENSQEHSIDSYKYCRLKSPTKSKANSSDDPYEMLQDLLREGSLIKEAVKRLQLGLNCSKPRKTNYYELDDMDIRSPTFL